MQNIFNMTREKLLQYTGSDHKLYDKVTSDAKTMWGKATSAPETIKNVWNGIKKLKK